MSVGEFAIAYPVCSVVVFVACAIVADTAYKKEEQVKAARLAFYLAPLGPFAFVVLAVGGVWKFLHWVWRMGHPPRPPMP